MNNLNVAQKHAKHYTARLGWALVPLSHGKRPTLTDWQNNPVMTEDEALTTWANGQNMGLHLEASGVVLVDVDHLEYARLAFAAVGVDLDAVLAAAPVRIKGRNSKPLYAAPAHVALGYAAISWPHPTEKQKNGQPKRVSVVEFRAGPGRQDVLPPSIHPDTKQPYTWEGTPPRSPEDIPELPAELLKLWENLDQTAAAMRAACPWAEQEAPRPQQQRSPAQPYQGESVIDAFNAKYTVHEILERNGYKQRGGKYLSPNSSTKAAGVTVYQDATGKARAHTYHGSDSWADGHGHDAFGLFVELEHG
ncbi:MAG: bifunctional DNA primase/polymerase, partial [Deinococcus sp.]|nr:bifunctional DNA primase/polymerase [Deinococcus sp.]